MIWNFFRGMYLNIGIINAFYNEYCVNPPLLRIVRREVRKYPLMILPLKFVCPFKLTINVIKREA